MLKIDQLHGGYVNQKIIHDISFDVNQGEIVGLLGLNGAGKSTTLQHIIGSLKPMNGMITINGKSLLTERHLLSYIPDTPTLYPHLTVQEHFSFIRALYKEQLSDYQQELITRYELTEHLHKYPFALSKGNKQKVSIVNALLAKPKYLIIDEPFMGLDPIGLSRFLTDLKKLRANQTAILLSTHLLTIAESLCDRVVVIHKGHQVTPAEGKMVSTEKQGTLEDFFFHLVGVNDE
ncbi:ABC transporter ATP-binding protein [Shouchella sp. JSM 1781072]|uniref:ABC transporter ATP-binding protein n=1 Tax=Shouchella sp. JSM 1781072 TaxID=3344581 RepID=UPI0035C092BD